VERIGTVVVVQDTDMVCDVVEVHVGSEMEMKIAGLPRVLCGNVRNSGVEDIAHVDSWFGAIAGIAVAADVVVQEYEGRSGDMVAQLRSYCLDYNILALPFSVYAFVV